MISIFSKLPNRLILCFCIVFLNSCGQSDKDQKINLDNTLSLDTIEQSSPAKESKRTYLFGFDLRLDPKEDARQYLPFLQYLEKTTGLDFDLRFTPENTTIVEMLGSGQIDFAAIGADTYIQANRKYNVIPLVRGLNSQNKAQYQSALVVHPDNKHWTIADMRGKRFAFGSKTSTQGHLIPRIILAEHNIFLKDLDSFTYTGSHTNCANAVSSGSADICGMQDQLAKDLAQDGLIKIAYMSQYYPSSSIVCRPAIEPQIRKKIQDSLIDFHPKGKDSDGLYNWDKTEMPNGFIAAKDGDYSKLRQWVLRLGY